MLRSRTSADAPSCTALTSVNPVCLAILQRIAATVRESSTTSTGFVLSSMWLPFVSRKRPVQINHDVINNLLSFYRRLRIEIWPNLFVATTKALGVDDAGRAQT